MVFKKRHYDYLVFGSGLAGLSFALKAKEFGSVAVISKTRLETGNTEMAQGGIAAAISNSDSIENHIRDTVIAGAGLCDESIVRFVAENAPARIQDLVQWGVQFDIDENTKFSLTQEGGHSQRRILHVEDHTGLDIQRQLLSQAKKSTNIDLYDEQFAIDIITLRDIKPKSIVDNRVVGAYILDKKSGSVNALLANTVILATGGAGKVYLYTSNWSGATGDGIAMAYRAGARVANLEFMQFHPTCLYHPASRNFLITEAMRGEGAKLVNKSGFEFMNESHPLGALAPRDIVARCIDAEIKKTGAECVYLDITHKPADFVKSRFPKIYENCLKLGIDITTEPIPVVPAAHYLCGGVLTDQHGKTDIPGLFALGETACTGLHGANRLASNSLLECVVFADSAASYLKRTPPPDNSKLDPLPWEEKRHSDKDELGLVSYMWDEIRRLMWAYVGIVRTNRRLERAQNRLNNILEEFKDYYAEFKTHPDIIELRNIALVADLTVKCARKRNESRGIHYNLDFLNTNEGPARDTIL